MGCRSHRSPRAPPGARTSTPVTTGEPVGEDKHFLACWRWWAGLPPPKLVLITGEANGKELVAEALHRNSARRGGPSSGQPGGISSPLFESEMFGT